MICCVCNLIKYRLLIKSDHSKLRFMASQTIGIDRTATDEPPTLSPMPERRSKKISISSGRETMADQAMHDLQLVGERDYMPDDPEVGPSLVEDSDEHEEVPEIVDDAQEALSRKISESSDNIKAR